VSVHGDLLGERGEFLFDAIELAEMAVERIAAERIERKGFEPREVFAREQVAGGRFDEALVKDRMDTVLDAGAVGGKHGAFGGALTHEPRFVVGNPDFWEIAGAQELGEREGIDFVGFDFGGGDGFGAQRVADNQPGDQRLEDGGDRPGVGGGFDGDGGVGGEVRFGEDFEGFAGGGETGTMEDIALVVDEGGFDFFFVEIQTGECHNSVTPFEYFRGVFRTARKVDG